MRFSTPYAIVKELSLEAMEALCARHPSLSKKFNNFRLHQLKYNSNLSLDYIIEFPTNILNAISARIRERFYKENKEEIDF